MGRQARYKESLRVKEKFYHKVSRENGGGGGGKSGPTGNGGLMFV